jgi:acetyl esterase/lipase
MKIWLIIRLTLALVLLLFGSIVLIRAKLVWLFQVQVAATEFGHWFALVALLLIVAGPWRSWAAVVALFACGLLMSSAVRAAWFARSLPNQHPPTSNAPAFSWLRLWKMDGKTNSNVRTLHFADHGGDKLAMDFYPSSSAQPSPCVMIIHLGGWDGGSRDEFREFSHKLQLQGYAVASIDYRLAPKYPWPAQRQDVLDAIHFLQTGAESYGVKKDQFVLMGRSAGGQIASAVALGANEPAIIGCISLYAPADLNFAWSYADPKDILDSDKLLRQYLGGTPKENQAAYDSASGIRFVTPQSIPVLLLHGTIDEMVWVKQSQRLAQKLAENQVNHHFLELPWATHAFDFNLNGPGGQITEWAVLQFLHEVRR